MLSTSSVWALGPGSELFSAPEGISQRLGQPSRSKAREHQQLNEQDFQGDVPSSAHL